ncbi:MAG TPA: hypothetical protein VN646_16945 [Candidatus Acidoferrum sp.]|nr:hypothetical protein [Candidatus Acidoferrum sp.]
MIRDANGNLILSLEEAMERFGPRTKSALRRAIAANNREAQEHIGGCRHCSTSPAGDLCAKAEVLYQRHRLLAGKLGQAKKAPARATRWNGRSFGGRPLEGHRGTRGRR